MAVYQISRIQIRRGQANQGTGLPQLASGEMAWAIDTQELYIGSGSVSEGAPGVSNIRIITQQDLGLEGSLLGLVQYVYGSSNPAITTGASATTPVGRPIAIRLDDQITTADFGAKGDGTTDDTAAIQRAINQLFLNPANPANLSTATTARVVLEILAGTYKTTNTIYIPSYASLLGAGIDKTIINYVPRSITVTGSTNISTAILTTSNTTGVLVGDIITGNGVPVNTTVTTIVANVSLTLSNNVTVTQTGASFTVTAPGAAFQFVNDSSTPGNPDPTGAQSTSQARKVHISGITVQTATGINTALQLNSVRESIFENLNLTGGWTGTLSANSVGIDMTAVSSLVTCEANIFRNIRIGGFNYAVFAKDDILNNTFENCFLQNTLQGFCLGLGGAGTLANPYGPRQTSVINSKFYNIKQEAVIVYTGTNNIVRDCKYVGVGNNGGTNALSQYPQVYFTTYGNASYNDQSDRHGDLFDPGVGSNPTFALVPYVPEVSGHGTYKYCGTKTITLISKSSYTQILKLPVPWTPTPADRTSGPTGQITYTIDYFYTSQSNAFTRQGTLTISADVANKKIQLSDEYNFAGTDSNFNTNTNDSVVLDFQAQFLDNTGAVTTTNPWTIVLSYVNNQSDSGILNYTYSSVF